MPRFKKTLRGIKELSQNNLCFCTALLNAIRVACSLHTCRYAPHKQPEYQIKIFGKNSIGYFIPLPKYSAWVCALFLTAGVCGVEKAESAAGESSKTAAAKKADDSTTVIEDKPTGKTVSENISGTGVYGKMETIIFPNIEFEDADIFSVIRYLNRGSKRYDPAKEGISIVAGFTKETASKLPKITMHFSKIPTRSNTSTRSKTKL